MEQIRDAYGVLLKNIQELEGSMNSLKRTSPECINSIVRASKKRIVDSKKIQEVIDKLNIKLHPRGLFVVAPSGAGKSHYVKGHNTWTDQDPFLAEFGEGKGDLSESKLRKADDLTFELKKEGGWVMGATWWNPQHIDAFIIPPESIIKKRLRQKTDKFPESYYGDVIKPHIENDIRPMAKKNMISKYMTRLKSVCMH